MAHTCPICGSGCHCGGDIDDIYFDGTPEQMFCTCCDNEDLDEDEINECDECGGCYGTHAGDCPWNTLNKPQQNP